MDGEVARAERSISRQHRFDPDPPLFQVANQVPLVGLGWTGCVLSRIAGAAPASAKNSGGLHVFVSLVLEFPCTRDHSIRASRASLRLAGDRARRLITGCHFHCA